MSNILAIETSTLTASVALLSNNQLVFERESGVNAHSEVLLPIIDESLEVGGITLGDLSTIAIGAGPGSFTGLRIGMATAKGLCFASGISLTPVSSLAALALDGYLGSEPWDQSMVAVLDARRREVFAGVFRRSGDTVVAVSEECVLPPSQLGDWLRQQGATENLALVGDGAIKYAELLAPIGTLLHDARATPSAHAVARLALGHKPVDVLASAAPSYVRLPEAEIKFPNGNPGGTFSVPE